MQIGKVGEFIQISYEILHNYIEKVKELIQKKKFQNSYSKKKLYSWATTDSNSNLEGRYTKPEISNSNLGNFSIMFFGFFGYFWMLCACRKKHVHVQLVCDLKYFRNND